MWGDISHPDEIKETKISLGRQRQRVRRGLLLDRINRIKIGLR
jgi:hypothetical protein